MRPIKTAADLRAALRACGSSFFDRKPRLHNVYPLPYSDAIFVTSGRFGSFRFEVRHFQQAGCHVLSVQEFRRREDAVDFARTQAGLPSRRRSAKSRLAPPDLLGDRRCR